METDNEKKGKIISDVAELISDTHLINVIDLSPRSGKTHGGLEWCLIHNKKFVSITNSHAICEHQLKTIQKICCDIHGIEVPVIVHLAGISKACFVNDRGCGDCGRIRRTYATFDKCYSEIIKKHRILNAKRVHEELPNICPHHFLKKAKEVAFGVVTVRQMLARINAKDVLFIDEETALRYFAPASAMLLSLKKKRGRVQYGESPLNKIRVVLEKLRKKILRYGKKKDRVRDQVIISAIDKLFELNDALQISSGIGNKLDDLITQWDAILRNISVVNIPEGVSHDDLFYGVSKYSWKVIDPEDDDSDDPAPFLHALIWNVGFLFQKQKGSNTTNVFLIGNMERRFYLEQFAEYKKIILAGGKETELFVDALTDHIGCGLDAVQTIDDIPFPYVDRFIVLPIKGKSLKKQIKEVVRMAKECNEKGWASLFLCGSKKQANYVRGHQLDKAKIIADRGDGVEELKRFASIGLTTIFYQNSKISRGVDTPFISAIFIYGAGFTQPYYEWLSKLKEGDIKGLSQWEIERKVTHGKEMLGYIKMMETTNSAMRISPTYGDKLGDMKIIVIPEKYLKHLRYLESRVTKYPSVLWSYIANYDEFRPFNMGLEPQSTQKGRNRARNATDGMEIKGNIYRPPEWYKCTKNACRTPRLRTNPVITDVNDAENSFSLKELEARAVRYSLPDDVYYMLDYHVGKAKHFLSKNGATSAGVFIEELGKIMQSKNEAVLKKFICYLILCGEICNKRSGRNILYFVKEGE